MRAYAKDDLGDKQGAGADLNQRLQLTRKMLIPTAIVA